MLQVTEKVLKELHSQKLQSKNVNAIVNRLALEVEKLTSAQLVQFCEYCIHWIQHSDGEQTRWGLSQIVYHFCSSLFQYRQLSIIQARINRGSFSASHLPTRYPAKNSWALVNGAWFAVILWQQYVRVGVWQVTSLCYVKNWCYVDFILLFIKKLWLINKKNINRQF
jgi:hypothetical protein